MRLDEAVFTSSPIDRTVPGKNEARISAKRLAKGEGIVSSETIEGCTALGSSILDKREEIREAIPVECTAVLRSTKANAGHVTEQITARCPG